MDILAALRLMLGSGLASKPRHGPLPEVQTRHSQGSLDYGGKSCNPTVHFIKVAEERLREGVLSMPQEERSLGLIYKVSS